jgi:hypothetical protein
MAHNAPMSANERTEYMSVVVDDDFPGRPLIVASR